MAREDDFMIIRLYGPNNVEKKFHIKKNIHLQCLKRAFCEFVNLDVDTLVFQFNGETIRDTDTPLSLELEKGSCMLVYPQREE